MDIVIRRGLCWFAAAVSFYGCGSSGDTITGSPSGATGSNSIATGQSTLNSDADPFVLVPGIGRAHASCVHEIPSNAAIDVDETIHLPGGSTLRFPPCAYGGGSIKGSGVFPGHSWVEASEANATTDAYGFAWWNWAHSEINVPNPPTNTTDGQTIFFFNGFVDSSGMAIVQPVLQWGPSDAGGGSFWTMANWYINSSGSVFHDSARAVTVGWHIKLDTQTDIGCGSNGSNCLMYIGYKAYDAAGTYQLGFAIDPTTPEIWTEAFQGVLEEWNVVSCGDYPSDGIEEFGNVTVAEPGPRISDYNANLRHGTIGASEYPRPVDSQSVISPAGLISCFEA